MSAVLIGAGQHGRVVAEACELSAGAIAGYVDPKPSAWLGAPRIAEGDLDPGAAVVIGLGGTDPDALARRLALIEHYAAAGMATPATVHPATQVSAGATIEDAAILLAGAIIQIAARIERGALINAGAIVEHDSAIGAGSHVAPGAIVLGDCAVGRCCMIGAGAVVLPGTEVPDATLIKAGTRWPR